MMHGEGTNFTKRPATLSDEPKGYCTHIELLILHGAVWDIKTLYDN